MDIKLIVCDLDGTLIDKDEVLPEFIFSLQEKLKSRNIIFTIATGRSNHMSKYLVDNLGIKAPIVINNGGMIKKENEVIYKRSFNVFPLKEGLMTAMNLGMSISFCHEEEIADTVMKKTNWTEEKYKHYGIYSDEYLPSEDEWEQLILQKITIVDKQFDIHRATDHFTSIDDINIVFYDDGGAEIVGKNINKANAVEIMADYLNIDLSNVMAIGNDMNDIEMIKSCGIGVSVGNAVKALKDVSDYVCENSMSAGVEEAIKKYCF